MDQLLRSLLRQSFLFVLLLLTVTPVDAATQRMLLLPSSLQIASGGAQPAPAMCLDGERDTPDLGAKFTYAPRTMNSATVSVGGAPPIPLQEAIDKKLVAVEGTGDYNSLTFRNLVPGKTLTIDIGKTSVITPNSSDKATDLEGLPQLANAKVNFSQAELWRASHATASQYRRNQHSAWVTNNRSRPVGEQALVVQRIGNYSAGGAPRYYLMTGGPVKEYVGNEQLHTLAQDAKAAWGNRSDRPRLVLTGDGDDYEFDAARLTMELSAAGGGGSRYRGPGGGGFDFEPPNGFGKDSYVYSGQPWSKLRIADVSRKRISAVQEFYQRGSVTVFTKTNELLAKLAAAVRQVMPELKDEPTSEAIDGFKLAGEYAFEDAIYANPSLRAEEQDAAEMVIVVDKQTEKTTFRALLYFDGNGIRVATLSEQEPKR